MNLTYLFNLNNKVNNKMFKNTKLYTINIHNFLKEKTKDIFLYYVTIIKKKMNSVNSSEK